MAKGLGALQSSADKAGGGGSFLKVEAGKATVIRMLQNVDDLVTVSEHVLEIAPGQWRTFTCLREEGQSCPCCEIGDKPKSATYLPVYDHTTKEVKIFKCSPTVAAQILQLHTEYGDLRERDFTLSRTGTKFETKYYFMAKDKDKSIAFPNVDIPDTEKMTMTKPAEDIRRELAGGIVASSDAAPAAQAQTGAETGAETGTAAPSGQPVYPF